MPLLYALAHLARPVTGAFLHCNTLPVFPGGSRQPALQGRLGHVKPAARVMVV